MTEVNLEEILEEPTIIRSENEDSNEINDFDLSQLGFDEEEDPILDDGPGLENENEDNLKKEESSQVTKEVAKEGAEMVVDLIDTVNTVGLTPLARWKLQKKRGGKEMIARMKEIFEKSFSDEELTDKEKKQLWLYEAYQKDIETAEQLIPFSQREQEKLVKGFTNYFHSKNINFSGGNSVWMDLAMIEGMKITGILTT